MSRIGEFRYTGNGKLLNNDETYTIFDIGNSYEAYPEGGTEPIKINRGTFVSLRRGNLEQTEGATPMG